MPSPPPLSFTFRIAGCYHIGQTFIHHFDPLTPMEETLRALDDLVRQGKVLYLGVSNWAAWRIAKTLGISAKKQVGSF